MKGLQHYEEMLDLQWKTWAKVKEGRVKPTLYLLQHKPVITLGRKPGKNNLLITKEKLSRKQIDFVQIDRGGSITYHAPGQLVGYIICKVSTFGGTYEFVTKILKYMVGILKSFKIDTFHSLDFPGIWVSTSTPRKIGAVGIQVKEGYSLHGFAINVDMNLEPFSYIIPCGITQPITTMALELKKQIHISEVIKKIVNHQTF